ncbi:MAG: serine hydrolase [Eubacteriales bacterium]|nr:serine hydrolase [Eubacteriales bacterium]
MRTELERCTPEEVGIPSKAIHALLTKLENGGFTQMHGFMIMRHNKVCAEGWWSPFAPGVHHCDHSLSKTYTATAIGIAEQEGLLSLSDPVAILLPEKMPQPISERLSQLTVRDLLVMGNGSEQEPVGYPKDWMEQYFRLPIEHQPGSYWRYNSHTSAILSAIVEKVSGVSMLEYLKPRLFDRIGIDSAHVLCRRDASGLCLGGHGMFTTVEDNLRLMKLYLNGGQWDGVRILSEKFVHDATTPQMDTQPAHAHTPWIYDNCVGYGYQLWMCRPEGSYRADGAYGQFSVVLPKLDMIISLQEDGYLGEHMSHNELRLLEGKLGGDAPVHGPQATLNALFELLLPAVQEEALPPSDEAALLHERTFRLSLPHPAGHNGWRQRELDVTLKPIEGKISFGVLYGMAKHRIDYPGADQIRLHLHNGLLQVVWIEDGVQRELLADARGGRMQGKLCYSYDHELLTDVSAVAWWDDENRLQLDLLWYEAVDENRFTFTFEGNQAYIEKCIVAGVNGASAREAARYAMA